MTLQDKTVIELLPCPFCGGEADFYHDWQTAGVECVGLKRWPVTCKVAPRTGTKRTRDEAIAAWNTRAKISAPVEDEGVVEAAYKEGWRIGFGRAQLQGPSNTADEDWRDSDAAMRSTPIEDGRVTGSREPSRVSPSRPVGFDPARCENCGGQGGGYGWVCENHPDKGWPDQCECGAGMPCGVCALQMASAGYVAREHERIVAWLKAIPESDSGWNPHDEQWDEGFDSAIRQVIAGVEKRVYAASADTHPEGGDAPENAAPSVMSGAVPERQTPKPHPVSRKDEK